MYAYLRGKLVDVNPEFCLLEVNGIGYKVYIPISLYANGMQISEAVLLHTSYVVREDGVKLFGFLEKGERDFFEKLLSLSGIGAKTALNLIGHLGLQELYEALQQANTPLLVRVPGVGKKTAERIIVELSDQMSKWVGNSSTKTLPTSSLATDALSALVHLGYQAAVAQKAIHKVIDKRGESLSLGELISSTLKEI
ncbi:MAG: Holliday junction branch migration protein RuvA [Verrucomicrobia bacterium]|nr:Holliday junction branch migration protein RuvA [Verrucomicrobiota bacterium]